MLETIYEVDETIIADDDSPKLPNKRFRLPYYFYWCMIPGCFITITLIIAISSSPFFLFNISTDRTSKNLLNVPFNSNDKLKISTAIINYLNIFSHQINKKLDLQPNTITFLTSTISNSLLEDQNGIDLLWIYGYLKYPQSCIDNIQCKENFHLKLKTSFIELSNSLTAIELDPYYDRQIQLDWCDLIENSTTATLVSLASVEIINQTTTEIPMTLERIICENMDQNDLLSEIIHHATESEELITTESISVTLDDQKLIYTTDLNNNSIENTEKLTIVCYNSIDYLKNNDDNNDQRQKSIHSLNDIHLQCLTI